MGTRITYVGPFVDGVEIEATGQLVGHGETVTIDDAGLAASLLEQAVWERPNTKAAKAVAADRAEPRLPDRHDPATSPAVADNVGVDFAPATDADADEVEEPDEDDDEDDDEDTGDGDATDQPERTEENV